MASTNRESAHRKDAKTSWDSATKIIKKAFGILVGASIIKIVPTSKAGVSAIRAIGFIGVFVAFAAMEGPCEKDEKKRRSACPSMCWPQKGKSICKILTEAVSNVMKFLFAWSLTDNLEHFFFVFLQQTTLKGAGLMLTFYYGLGITFIFIKAIWIIAPFAEQPVPWKMWTSFCHLALRAAPLNVGWAWKAFWDTWFQELEKEWKDGSMEMISTNSTAALAGESSEDESHVWYAELVLCITMYVFLGFAFNLLGSVEAYLLPKEGNNEKHTEDKQHSSPPSGLRSLCSGLPTPPSGLRSLCSGLPDLCFSFATLTYLTLQQIACWQNKGFLESFYSKPEKGKPETGPELGEYILIAVIAFTIYAILMIVRYNTKCDEKHPFALIVRTLPLAVGFAANSVLAKMRNMFQDELVLNTQDTKDAKASLVMFVKATYFFALAALITALHTCIAEPQEDKETDPQTAARDYPSDQEDTAATRDPETAPGQDAL